MSTHLKVATWLPVPFFFAEWQPGCQEIQA
jgi:hypothetical protein